MDISPRHPALHLARWLLLAAAVLAGTGTAAAQFRAGRLERMRQASLQTQPVAVPAGARAVLDVAYGPQPAQRLDAYLPAEATSRAVPVIFYVHGGGWTYGDKTNAGMQDKLGYWLPRGYAVVSVNYRMVPEAMALAQAGDVARALAAVQGHARSWGLDTGRIVLMGHSAGAHLIALLGADPSLLAAAGAPRPRAVVSLDSGALDVATLMQQPRVPPMYRNAFGSDPAGWAAASPSARLQRGAVPMLLVCSSIRSFPIPPCPEAQRFAARAAGLGVPMQVLPEALSHAQINQDLGVASDYTSAVSAYIDRLLR